MDLLGGGFKCRCCVFEFDMGDEVLERLPPPPPPPKRRSRSRGDHRPSSESLERLPSDAEIATALKGVPRFDSHAHVHHLEADEPKKHQFAVVAQACEEEEWDKVVKFCSKSSRYIAGLGVHPWQAHLVEDPEAMADRLAESLQAHPRAIVGEIGLCKCAKNVRGKKDERDAGFAKQVAVFEAQLAVAAKLNRPVSIHSVKANAALKNAITTICCDPSNKGRHRVALHSFSGTADLVRELLRDYTPLGVDLYFGFSHTVNVEMNRHNNTQKRRDALFDAISAVPDDRVLVESDVDDLPSAHRATDRAIALIAAVKGWSLADCANRTSRNALDWLKRDEVVDPLPSSSSPRTTPMNAPASSSSESSPSPSP